MLFKQEHNEGLFLDLAELIAAPEDGEKFIPVKVLSTAKVYKASNDLIAFLEQRNYQWNENKAEPIGHRAVQYSLRSTELFSRIL